MKMKFCAIALGLALGYVNGVVMADNTINTSPVGLPIIGPDVMTGSAYSLQVTAAIHQDGTEHVAKITQNNLSAYSNASIDQHEVGNFASIVQSGALWSYAHINQSHYIDTATVQQTGVNGGKAVIEQTGKRGVATVVQWKGYSLSSYIQQSGIGNTSVSNQSGGENFSTMMQSGMANEAALSQRGHWNQVEIQQSGNGISAQVTQAGSGSGYAQRNVAMINQSGNNHFANVTQAGSANQASVTQH